MKEWRRKDTQAVFLHVDELWNEISDDSGSPNLAEADEIAKGLWAQRRVENTSVTTPFPEHVTTTYHGIVWLLLVPGTGVDEDSNPVDVWHAYAMTTKEDVLGWPLSTGDYTGLLTAQEIAQALKDAGKTVVLREYTDFATTYDTTGSTVTLT